MFGKETEELGVRFINKLSWRLNDVFRNKENEMRCWQDGFEHGCKKTGKKDKPCENSYTIFTRLMYIIENRGIYLDKYMRKFEISRRTAFRDIDFIRTYKDYDLVLENGRYNLIRTGVYIGS